MSGQNNYREIFELLEQLCKNLAGPNHTKALKHVTKYISSSPQSICKILPYDENSVVNKITNYLSSKSQSKAQTFMNIHEQMSTCTDQRNRNSVLTFLLYLADTGNNNLKPNGFKFEPFSNLSATTAFLAVQGTSSTLKLHEQPSTSHEATSSFDTDLKIQRNYSQMNFKSSPIPSTVNIIVDELMQDALYSFIGIQGKYLRKDIISGGFKLDPKSRVLNASQAGILLRLAELGYYHDQIQSFTDSKSGRSPIGLLGQGLMSELKNELTNYYGMVAMLQEKLNRQRNEILENLSEKLTLLRIMCFAAEPLHRLQWIVKIADACQNKRGGVLASTIYDFQHNGDSVVKCLARDLLLAVCGPLMAMLSRWLLDGEIEDPHSEFFIEILPEVSTDRLWHDKYRVREALLPSFISKQMANKILVTGKSINFLREVCQDKTAIEGREELKQSFENNVENLFAPVPDTPFHIAVENSYLYTSKKVLDIVSGPHKLLEHLHAMRRYLLLGQGDFIGLLMEHLKPELDRPAKDLYRHDLNSIVDSAIRATNAQYDDPEILNHLDVKLLDHYDGDVGWDCFTLQYSVHGPLSTMLEPSMLTYKILFKPLWRTKHIEFVLSSKIWKNQICNAKYLRLMQKELKPIVNRLNLYTAEMIHFINQMQYYILFEVLECSWANFMKRAHAATALDDILEAHHDFLEAVRVGTFLGDNSSFGSLTANLDDVYSSVIKLETWQDHFYKFCNKEMDARKKYDKNIVLSEKRGDYGVTAERRMERDEELKQFEHNLYAAQKDLDTIGSNYEASVRQFLLMLASTNDLNLQLFGIRLDFNDYYKKRDQRLGAQLTYENIRLSNMFFNSKNNTMIGSKFVN